jgi:tetratricopeptide (TPR) repeat protein
LEGVYVSGRDPIVSKIERVSDIEFPGEGAKGWSILLRGYTDPVHRRIYARFLPMLAGYLSNLGTMQGKAGMHEAALASTRETLERYGELTRVNRPVYLSKLAKARYDLASKEKETSRRGEALDNAQEAVNLYRELIELDRRACLLMLAKSLSILGVLQSEVDYVDSASTNSQEAMTYYRELLDCNDDPLALRRYGVECALLANLLLRRQRPLEAVEIYSDCLRTLLPLVAFASEQLDELTLQLGLGLFREYLDAVDLEKSEPDAEVVWLAGLIFGSPLEGSGEPE